MQFATTSSTDEVMELVQDQHREILHLLGDVADARGDQRRDAFFRLRRYLAIHEAVEESFVHPVGEREFGDPDVVTERLEEEDGAGELMTSLESFDADSDDFECVLADLTEAVRTHAEAEETEEFPAVLAAADDAELGQMAQGLEYVVELATQPGGPLGAVDTSPFLVCLDHAKEEFGQLAEQRNDSP